MIVAPRCCLRIRSSNGPHHVRAGEMAYVNTSANKPKRHFRRWVMALLLAPLIFWCVATPQVSFHFSDKGQGRLGYILNVQHDLSKGEIYPGQTTGGAGHIFPNSQFFMEFDWNNGGNRTASGLNRSGRRPMSISGKRGLSIAERMASSLKHAGHCPNRTRREPGLSYDVMTQYPIYTHPL